jgi:sensor domain CHASE-containing protein
VTLSGLDYGLIGIYLLIVAAIAIVIECGLAAWWSARIARRSQTLNQRLLSERANLEASVARLQMTLEEMKVLWEPYGRLLGWVQHPLAIALMQSLARRVAVR